MREAHCKGGGFRRLSGTNTHSGLALSRIKFHYGVCVCVCVRLSPFVGSAGEAGRSESVGVTEKLSDELLFVQQGPTGEWELHCACTLFKPRHQDISPNTEPASH